MLDCREVCHFTSVFETPLSYEGVHRQVDLESQRDPAKRVAWSGKTSLFLPSTLSSSQDTPAGQPWGRGKPGRRAPHYHPPPRCHPAWERKYATSGSISKDKWDPQRHVISQGDQSNMAKVWKLNCCGNRRPLSRRRLACWISIGWVSPNITSVSR